jgi:Rod binding domain-containing protein
MTVNPVLSTGLTAAPSAADKNNPQKIREAASQFEALMIGQILKSTHEDGSGWLGTGEDQTASSAMGMADEYLAQSMAKRGGLGLAKMISAGLDHRGVSNSSPATEPNPVEPGNRLSKHS